MKDIKLFDKQDSFIFDEHRFTAYIGGFGNGKTLAGSIKAYNHCMQEDAFFLIGRRHATDLSDSTQRDFLNMFGHMGKFSPKNGSFKFYKNGKQLSEVIFRHLDDLQSLTNMNLSGFWIDQSEEVSEDVFDFLVGRIRRPVKRREGFITANPNGHDWLWRRFLKKIGKDGKELPNASDYFLVTASTLENRSNLPEDYIKGLLSQPQEYVKRFVEGSFDVFAGQIFDEFNPHIHVLPQPFQIPNTWERFRAIDHGQNNPTSCHWYAVDFDGNIFCVGPKTKILTSDLRHIDADTVKVGDSLMGFDENVPPTKKRRWKEAIVEKVTKVKKPSYKITLDDGTEVICSSDHQWLTETGGTRKQWRTVEEIKDNWSLFRITDVWEDDNTYGGGYLAAAFDGEGCLITNNRGTLAMNLAQKDNGLLTTVKQELDQRNIRYGEYQSLSEDRPGYDVCTIAVTRKKDILKLLGSTRPKRLLPKFHMDNMVGFSAFAHPKIIKKEFLGETEVIAIQTSTRTYIAEGLASHNCYQEYYREKDVVSNHVARINEMSRIRTTSGDFLQDTYAYTVIDPSTHAKTLEKNGYRFSVADEYMDAGIPTIAAQNDVIAGINRVKEYLRIDPTRYHAFLKDVDGDPIMGAPRLYIFPQCTNLIEEIGQYKWKSYTGMSLGSPERDDIKEAPVKRKDHAVDDLRYAIMSRPQAPLHGQQIQEWVLANPIELARRAQQAGMTVDDFRAQRYNRTMIRHSESGIKHSDGLK